MIVLRVFSAVVIGQSQIKQIKVFLRNLFKIFYL